MITGHSLRDVGRILDRYLRDRSRPSDFDCIINDLAPARIGILSVILSIGLSEVKVA